MGLKQATAVNIGWTAFGQMFTVALHQLVLLVLANILDPLDFGIYAACMVVNGVLTQVSTMGLDYAVINSKDEWRKVLGTGTTLRILLSVVGFSAIVLLSGMISGLFEIDDLEIPLIIVSMACLMAALMFPPQMSLTKELRFRQISVAKIAGSLVWSTVSLALALSGWSYWSLVVAFISSQLVVTIAMYVLSKEQPSMGYQSAVARDLLGFGGVTAAGGILAYFAVNLDKFVVGSVVGPEGLGIYWAMYTYGTVAAIWLTGIVNAVMFPTYAVISGNMATLRKAYSHSLRFVSEFSSLVSMGLAGGSAIFVMVLLGAQWEEGVLSLSLLSLAGFFLSLTSPAANVFISVGRPDLILKITLIFFLPMVPLLALSADTWGIVGAASVVLGHEASKCLYVVYRAGRIVEAERGDLARQIAPFAAAGGASGGLVLAVYLSFGASPVTLVLALSLGVLAYLLLGWLFSRGALAEDIREAMRAVRRR